MCPAFARVPGNGCRPSLASRATDRLRSPPRDRARRRHPRRRAGHADALRDAEAAASAVRPADDRLAGRGRPRGRRARGRRRRRPGPAARAPALDGTVEVAIQEQPRGTADAVKAAAAHFAAGRHGDRAQRRRPADHAPDTIAELAAGPRARRAPPRRWPPRARRSQRLRPGRAGARRDRRAGRRDQGRRATPPSSSSTSARSTPASSRSRARRCWRALEEVAQRQRPGRAATCPTCCRSSARTSGPCCAYELADPAETLGINDRSALARVPALAQRRIHERHMLAGVTIVDPGGHGDRRRRGDRRRTR